MRIQPYDIVPALQPYVKLICSMESDGDMDTRHIRVLPDACVELFLSYTVEPVAIISEELYKGSIVTFRMSESTDVQMRKGAGVIAICFHRGMVHQFIKVPMYLLSNTTMDLADVWGYMAREIEDEIVASVNNEARVDLMYKKIFKWLIVVSIFSSCSEEKWLEEIPKDFYSPENSFTKPADFESAVVKLYADHRARFVANDNLKFLQEYLGTHTGITIILIIFKII